MHGGSSHIKLDGIFGKKKEGCMHGSISHIQLGMGNRNKTSGMAVSVTYSWVASSIRKTRLHARQYNGISHMRWGEGRNADLISFQLKT